MNHYQSRITKFIDSIYQVKKLKPENTHLWRVMDTTAFQDTEVALETALYNAKETAAAKRRASKPL